MNARLSFLFLVLVLIWAGLVFRGTSLKLFPDQRLIRQKNRQFSRSITVPAKRGTVFDRNGVQLAVSVPSYSLFADPKLIQDKKQVARQLRRVLGGSVREFEKLIAGEKRRFVWIQRKLDSKTKVKISELKNPGLGFVQEPKRVYPNNHLLAQVLGFIGREGHGLEGLEYKLNQQLQGESVEQVVPRDARGRPLVGDARLLLERDDGMDVKLTIDHDTQYFLESALMDAIDLHEAESATGVILSVETGEVLAMASVPGPDANQARLYASSMRRNRAIADAFEPGSTMKTFVVAAALEHELVTPATNIDCEGGRMKVGKRWIKEADPSHYFDNLTVNEILSFSSNVGAAKLGFQLGDKRLSEFLRKLGFGKKTQVGLPGESKGIFQNPPWSKHLLSNVSFGHGIATTPIQMASAYLAIANGGVYVTPKIVKSIGNPMTGKSAEFEVPSPKRVMSEEVASTLSLMLTQATTGRGTGGAARVPGYPVAGKTGTAQKVDARNGGYLKGQYISSFSGFLPSHDPKFVIYVSVDSPENKYYGSQVAAPIFSKLGKFLVRKAGVSPVLLKHENVISTNQKEQQKKAIEKLKLIVASGERSTMPSLEGLNLRHALKVLRGISGGIKVNGKGVVTRTLPAAGEVLHDNQVVKLHLDEKTL